jgi:multiple sugar transport system permease protein
VNTLLLSACVVAITVVAAVPAGYVLARWRLPGAANIGLAIFLTYLVPPIIVFLPLARVVGTLGLFDSWWALVVVYPTFTILFCTWLLMGFFKTLPPELEEAAWVARHPDRHPVRVHALDAGVPLIYYWGSLMAAALLVGLPVAIAYAFFIDHFIRGLTGAAPG